MHVRSGTAAKKLSHRRFEVPGQGNRKTLRAYAENKRAMRTQSASLGVDAHGTSPHGGPVRTHYKNNAKFLEVIQNWI